jgi:eukaryotic-like serine/threonine-protein kinase
MIHATNVGDERAVSSPSPRMTQPPDAMIGSTLAGKYKIIKKLGEGGMGTVYQAQQMPIDRLVAIKVLLGKLATDEVAVKRFEQEARAISKMQHPNTVTIYDYGKTDEDRLYIVMEFLRGKTLTDALRATGGMGLEVMRGIGIIRQVCASLADAHGAGIIHRDLKPDNIFLCEVGGSKDWVKVLDFGVAKLADNEAGATLTQTGMIFGTPKYMSPEQAEGKPIDFRADIYALGVVLYELMTGRPPFIAETPVALLLKHISEAPAPFRKIRPEIAVPPEVEAVVMRALEKDPDRRQLTVDQLATELENASRFVAGSMSMAPAPLSATGARPIPTEINPLHPNTGLTDLRPPNAVPSGMSISPDIRRLPTEPAPPGMSPTGATAQGQVDLRHMPDFATAGLGTGTMPGGATRPIPGPGVDTLGGIPGVDPSQALRAKPKSRVGIFAGIGLAVAAIGVVAIASTRSPSAKVESQPLDPAPIADPRPVEPPPSAPAPTPQPQAAAPEPTPAQPTKQKAPENTTKTKRPEPPPPAKASQKVAFHFSSSPSGAVVELDGAQLGRTPFTREFVRGSEMLSVEFKLDGYETKKQIFTLSNDRTIDVELKKIAASSAPGETKQVEKRPPQQPPAQPPPKNPNLLDDKVDSDLK